jgi:D-alanine-D-alanine ligase
VFKVGLTVALCFNLGKDLVPRDDEPPDLHCELDSEKTIHAIAGALASAGNEVMLIEADDDAPAKLAAARPDVVFNVAEGLRGESRESFIPAVCDALGIPYTGSGVLTLAVSLDKAMAKRVFAFEGVPTPPFCVIQPGQEIEAGNLRYPLFVKPLREGSSMGISERSRAENYEQLREQVLAIHHGYRQPALVEEFLSGREFTVGILGNEQVEFFPIMEINYQAVPEDHNVYSRHFKAEWSSWNYYFCPAPLSDIERYRLQETALAAYRAVGCRDLGRVDIRCDRDGQPCVMEINPIPGLSPGFSDYPRMAEVGGYSHAELINAILERAVQRTALAARRQAHAKTG